MENVILVDKLDNPIGEMEKMEAHKKGLLHRAFSIFLFSENQELLLQKRASSKYHSGGLWTNTCCSHPRLDETILEAGTRRLHEEMGFTTELKSLFSFIYQAELDNNLIEHELDHVIIGSYSGVPSPNSLEVEDWKYMPISDLEIDIKSNPSNYTIWFKIIFDRVKNELIH